MAFFEFALSGFWTFIGVLILVAVSGQVLIACFRAVIGPKGNKFNVKIKADDVVKVVRSAIDSGKLDGPISRVIARNKQRGA